MSAFKVRNADIVSEIIDGEAIIMDLKSGIYFSAQDVGALIWDGIMHGFDKYRISHRICQAYLVEPGDLAPGLNDFIAAAVANNLVEDVSGAALAPEEWSIPLPAARLGYVLPVLQSYGDIQDLALLDPIHDVLEEEGWPSRKAAP
jgi:hypothetical protein